MSFKSDCPKFRWSDVSGAHGRSFVFGVAVDAFENDRFVAYTDQVRRLCQWLCGADAAVVVGNGGWWARGGGVAHAGGCDAVAHGIMLNQ
jgi:hypothetical protein